MTDQSHTPLPWSLRDHTTDFGGRHIWVEGGPEIGRTRAGPYKRQILEDEDYDEKLGDAQLIVLSVNSLPSLVKALETARQMIRGQLVENAVVDVQSMQSLGDYIDAALSSYRGEGK